MLSSPSHNPICHHHQHLLAPRLTRYPSRCPHTLWYSLHFQDLAHIRWTHSPQNLLLFVWKNHLFLPKFWYEIIRHYTCLSHHIRKVYSFLKLITSQTSVIRLQSSVSFTPRSDASHAQTLLMLRGRDAE